MKQTVIPMLVFSALLFSCGDTTDKKVEDTVAKEMAGSDMVISSTEDKNGTFSFDGKEVSAKVETQYFGDKTKGNFSVVCQHNESDNPANANFELLQVTFISEKDATTNTHLKIYEGGSSLPVTEPEPGIVAVSLTGVGNGFGSGEFTGNEKSTGSIAVANRTIIIKDLVLFTGSGEKRVVNATLRF